MLLRFEDGSALRISTREVVLTETGASGRPVKGFAFAKAYALAEGWVFLPGDTRWPFRPWQSDGPLALPEGVMRAYIARYVRSAKFVLTDNRREKREAALAGLRTHYGDVLGGRRDPDPLIDPPVILVLTVAEISDGRSIGSREFTQVLHAVIKEHLDHSDIMLLDPHGPARIWKPQALLGRLEEELQRAAAETVSLPGHGASPDSSDQDPNPAPV